MATPKDLKTFEAIYPIFIQKYETFIPSEENSGVTEKINSMIQYLSQIGRLNNDVVKNWNKVMEWLLAEGLGEAANIEINKVLASGVFDTILIALVDEKAEELESILVDLRETGTGFDAQARQDIITVNQQLTEKTSQINTLTSQKATKTEVDIERQRINNFTSLTEGSTTGDAELMDVRVGANGITYTNAGESIREQVTDIKNVLGVLEGKFVHGDNYLNIATLVGWGTWCNYTNGKFESTEYVTEYGYYPYTKVKPSTQYARVIGTGQFGTVFFDENNIFISGVQTDVFTTPANCEYAVLNIANYVNYTDQVLIERNTAWNSSAEGVLSYYEELAYSRTGKDVVTIGASNSDFTTIKAGFAYALEHDKEVLIRAGTYDLVAEGISGEGYILPKKVVGYGATLLCHLPTEDWILSPLNVSYLTTGSEVYGLTVICSNCRYNIHDDMGAMTRGRYYKNVFKDLTLIHNSAPSATLISPNNIGGGHGDAGEIWIENCIMESNGYVNSDYHSSFAEVQTEGCKTFFKDCVMNKKVTATSLGSATDYMNTVYVTNCLCGILPQPYTGNNCKLIPWNNVLQVG